MARPNPRFILSTVALAGIAAVLLLLQQFLPHLSLPQAATVQPGYYRIVDVSDGDTFSVDMDGRIEKVRMIGVDTPETVKPNSPVECYGQAASAFTKQTLKDQTVRLEADPINQNRDRYDRLLRYAYLQDGRLLNLYLISEGYGFAYLSFPFTRAEEFREAQITAREQGKGLWGANCLINDQNGRFKTNEL